VQVVVARGGTDVATLACATRAAATLTSTRWTVPAGTGAFIVTVRVASTTLSPAVEVIPR